MKQLSIFCPARLSSERCPNKMIRPLIEDKTLFDIACEKLYTLKKIYNINTYVLLCEEDYQLISIANYYNIDIIYRSKLSTQVDGPLTTVFGDINKINSEYLMFLNPCLYNLPVEEIQKACNKFINSNWEYATSVKPFKNWLFYDNKPITNIDYKGLNTKNINGYYQAAHCFHIFNKKQFLETGKMLDDGLGLIEISDENYLLDVDTESDFEYAKYFFQKKV